MEQKRFKALVVDDDLLSRKLLEAYISARPELELVDIAEDGVEALGMVSPAEHDLVFLDINLPYLSGLDVIELADKLPYTIFTTAHREYELRAHELEVGDYLLKPISQEQFNRAVDRMILALRSREGESGSVSESGSGSESGSESESESGSESGSKSESKSEIKSEIKSESDEPGGEQGDEQDGE